MDRFDVWVLGFEAGSTPVLELQRVFEIDSEKARQIATNLPCLVKRGAPAEAAGQIGAALEAIGASVKTQPTGSPPPTVATVEQTAADGSSSVPEWFEPDAGRMKSDAPVAAGADDAPDWLDRGAGFGAGDFRHDSHSLAPPTEDEGIPLELEEGGGSRLVTGGDEES